MINVSETIQDKRDSDPKDLNLEPIITLINQSTISIYVIKRSSKHFKIKLYLIDRNHLLFGKVQGRNMKNYQVKTNHKKHQK